MTSGRRGFQAALLGCLALLSTGLPLPAAADEPRNPPRIAIIIDDLGYHRAAGRRAVALPGPVALAVLPQTPRAVELADAAHAAGKDVLLHLPMQSLGDDQVEPGNIILDMSRGELARTFDSNLRSIPHVVGVNTHRGSLVTQHPGHMHWLMQEIGARGGLFFVDSYTTAGSVALEMARESGIAAVRRDVFLDPDRNAATVAREFERLKRLAVRRGMAVGIGHPYPATLEFLERELPLLADEGVQLLSISDYVRQSQNGAGAGTDEARRSAAGGGE